jgi:hypothetical protein
VIIHENHHKTKMSKPCTARYHGEWTLSAPQTYRMLNKYSLPTKKLEFIEKKTGTYYVFKTPDNLIYVVDDALFGEKMCGNNIPTDLHASSMQPEDTFRIQNSEFHGLIQYKKAFHGDYYVMRTASNMKFILSGLDVDILPNGEKENFLSREPRFPCDPSCPTGKKSS